MNQGMVLSGVITAVFGVIFLLMGFLPLGILVIVGLAIFVLGIGAPPSEPVTPEDPNKRFCWYCMEEIDLDEKVCPYCGLEQIEDGSKRD
ncbi:MAG: hypothetical protein NZ957_03315 [Thaumarchaeota archaeon]|nr:hypothetical protein [Candidatus Calditenuaceae archaeon]MDW8042151.1 hypothetical protein [Nitrososphaerota archaeon]